MDASLTEPWAGFYTAVAGAAGALVGLIIVAMSVTIKEIIASRSLPSRAGATISAMVLILVVCCIGLVPGQGAIAFGVEVAACALVALIPPVLMTQRTLTDTSWRQPASMVFRIVGGIVPVLVMLVGGVLVATSGALGLAWIAVAIVLVFITSMLNAWVLLVEIQR